MPKRQPTLESAESRPAKKPELTDADKALLEAEPDWERMGQAAKRLLSEKPDQRAAPKARRSDRQLERKA